MNLVPSLVIIVLHESPAHSNVRANGRDHGLIIKRAAGRLRIRLRHMKVTHNLEHQVAALCSDVAVVQQIGKLRIQPEPSLGVTIFLAANARRFGLVRRSHKRASPQREIRHAFA
jgi:hypothetical protein